MPDISVIIRNWWKQLFFTVILSLLIVGTITFLKRRQYLSVATAAPASSYISDRSQVFNENIQQLYSALGTPDDLDLVVGTARLDTVYMAVTDQFNLFDHYKLKEQGSAARTRAAARLKANTRVMKSDYGELKVKVWDTDKNLAPQLANGIMARLQDIHTHLKSAGNEATLSALTKQREKLSSMIDSSGNAPEKTVLLKSQLQEYDKMIGQYQLMVDSKPPALIIVENAKAAEWPDKPQVLRTLMATAFFSLLFALLTALVLERKKLSR